MLYIAIGVFLFTCGAGAWFMIKQRNAPRYVDYDAPAEDQEDADITVVTAPRD